jgi:hypothetical protein
MHRRGEWNRALDTYPRTSPKNRTWSSQVLRPAQDERFGPVRGELVEPPSLATPGFWDGFLVSERRTMPAVGVTDYFPLLFPLLKEIFELAQHQVQNVEENIDKALEYLRRE